MNIVSLKDMCGSKYTLLICGDSLNLCSGGKVLCISKEQFNEIVDMTSKEWYGDKSKCHKCGKVHKGLCLDHFKRLLSKVGVNHDS